MSGIGRRLAVGAGWMVLMRFADRAVGLVSTAILARLLVPRDFGLVALATSLIAILDMIGELSVELVLIQNQGADRRHYDTAWTLNIIKGIVLAGVLVLLAIPTARFFSEPRVASIVYWLALSVVLGGFENIGIVDFRKDLQFHREFIYVTASRIIATIVTVALAFVRPGPGALVAGMIARRVVALGLSFEMQRFRPRLSLSAFTELFRFSRWVMIENLLTAVRQRSHSLVVGRVAGTQALGYYSMAYELAMLASSEIEQPIRRAVFPGYAKVASDPLLLRRAFLDVFGMIAVLGAPLAVGVGMIAPLIVPLLLGPRWLETIPLIQILSLFGLMVVLGGGTRLVYLAINKPYIATLLSAVDAAVLVPLTLLGAITAGVIGVAWAMVITVTMTWFVAMFMVMRFLEVPLRAIGARLWRVTLGLVGMAFAVGAVQVSWKAGEGIVGTGALLVVCVGVGAAVYGGILVVGWLVSGRPEDAAEHHVLIAGRAALHRLIGDRSLRHSAPVERDRAAAGRLPEVNKRA
jgi:O-antigen/teichoic acid export membrane protein